jgi:hypothetical protein
LVRKRQGKRKSQKKEAEVIKEVVASCQDQGTKAACEDQKYD